VALATGDNDVSLQVGNAEAWVAAPASLRLAYAPPQPPARAVVRWESPAAGATVAQARLEVAWTVASTSKVERIRLRVNDQSQDVPPRDQPGTVRYTTTLELAPDANRLQLEVVNAGGVQQAEDLVVTYAPPPGRVLLQEPAVTGFKAGRHLLPAVDHGELTLKGHVTWASQAAAPGEAALTIHVNGFRLPNAPLRFVNDDRGPRLEFAVTVVLNQEGDNWIDLGVAGGQLPIAAGEATALTVPCTQPVKRLRMFLLVAAAQAPADLDPKQVAERAAAALGDRERMALELAPGSRVLAGPKFDRSALFNALANLRTRAQMDPDIRTRQALGVLVVYYAGREVMNADGQLCWALGRYSPALPLPADLQPVADLRAPLETFPGAKLLLLDLAGGGDPRPLRDLPPSVAVLRAVDPQNGKAPAPPLLTAWADPKQGGPAQLRPVADQLARRLQQEMGQATFWDRIPPVLERLTLFRGKP
jgi:hypothetical protein